MKIRNVDELISHIDEREKVKYLFFWGHKKEGSIISKSCLSQWYESPFEEKGKAFITAESYMMYQKAKLFGDDLSAKKILNASSPGEAKSIGRQVSDFNELIWLENRFEIVVKANFQKFSQNEKLKEFLLNTSNRVLVEASPVDRIWGIGLAKDDPASENPEEWKGLNLLGFALMEVRDQLRNS